MAEPDHEDVQLFLEAVKSRQKFPRSCIEAYNTLENAPDDTTERIFFDRGGLSAWAACILTRKLADGTGHASGKTKRQRLLGRVDAMPIDSRRKLAVQLAAAIEPERERIERLVNAAKHRPERIRRPTHSAQPDDDSERDIADDETQDSHTEPRSSNQVFRQASIAECSRLFPYYLAGSICRKTDRDNTPAFFAAITMSLQTDGLGWELKLEVTDNKVERIAWELFDAHVETVAGSRRVYLAGGGGTSVVPYPSFLLQGCQTTAAYKLFGSEIADAVFASPAHQLEVKEGRDLCTECIKMIIRQAPSDNADICLLLPPAQGTSLRDRLYGPDAA